jgi:hypothetical protein
MLVEISQRTLDRMAKYELFYATAPEDNSEDEWLHHKRNAQEVCNSLSSDVKHAERLNTISNKADDYAQEQVDTARTLEAGE